MDNLSIPLKMAFAATTCLVLGMASGFFTSTSVGTWFPTLQKPSWNPPGWIFGPVWTILYLLMGIALAYIWHSNHPKKELAITVFIIQFILNLAWSFIFFHQRQIGIAFIEILILLVVLVFTTLLFFLIRSRAGYLLVPYLLWVAFASVLNGTIWRLNS